MKPGILLLLLLSTAASAQGADAELRRCRGIGDAAQRLACYDALPLPTPSSAGAAAAAPLAAPRPAAAPAAQVPTGAAPAAAAVPATAPVAAEASFGLRSNPAELPEITSHVAGRFDGWSRNKRIRLANGQVWQVIDDGRAYYDLQNPKVTVRRAALGSFMMEIDGVSGSPRVRRIE